MEADQVAHTSNSCERKYCAAPNKHHLHAILQNDTTFNEILNTEVLAAADCHSMTFND
jgi:hypothetical protein